MLNPRNLLVLAASVLLAAALFAQDSNDQALGDVARQSNASKPQAKVVLDEDNSQPAPAADATAAANSSAQQNQTDASGDQAAAQQAQQSKPSLADQIKALDLKISEMKGNLQILQNKIDNSSGSSEDAVSVWRQALADGQQNIADMEKQKAELEAQERENPDANGPAAPADGAQQPAAQPQSQPQ